jgi:HEAT repeat protein
MFGLDTSGDKLDEDGRLALIAGVYTGRLRSRLHGVGGPPHGMNAALGIGYMGETGKEAIPQLLELAKAPNEIADVRLSALNALQYIAEHNPASTAANVSDLIELLNDPNFTVVHCATRVIGATGSYAEEAVSPLTALLNYSVTREEGAMQMSIGNEPDAGADESKLNRRVASLTRYLRTWAAEALQQIGPVASGSIPMLERLLQDPDKEVRASAGIALWEIGGRTDGATAIAENLSPANWESLHKGLNALGEMGPAAAPAISAVEHLARFIEPEIREPALAALTKINPTGAMSPSIKSQ